MGLLGIIKANFGSTKVQRELEAAIERNDKSEIIKLISESISKILKAGLTKKQLARLQVIRNETGQELTDLFTVAFQRGWKRNGMPNLSNAMDEVLLEAQQVLEQHRPNIK